MLRCVCAGEVYLLHCSNGYTYMSELFPARLRWKSWQTRAKCWYCWGEFCSCCYRLLIVLVLNIWLCVVNVFFYIQRTVKYNTAHEIFFRIAIFENWINLLLENKTFESTIPSTREVCPLSRRRGRPAKKSLLGIIVGMAIIYFDWKVNPSMMPFDFECKWRITFDVGMELVIRLESLTE